MAQLPDEVIEALEDDQSITMIATSDDNGSANLVPAGSFKVIDPETLAYACFFSGKTKKNLETSKNASLVVYLPPFEGYQIKGKFVKWEKTGEIYDTVAGAAMEQLKNIGLSLTPQAVGIVKVTEAYVLSLPLAGDKIA